MLYKNTKTGRVQDLPPRIAEANPYMVPVDAAPCVGCGAKDVFVSPDTPSTKEFEGAGDSLPKSKKGGEE